MAEPGFNEKQEVVLGSGEHAEAMAFVEKHRDFLEHHARGEVRFVPAPEGLQTFAYNLETDEIYVNSVFFKKHGLSEEKTLFATCHEAGHYSEVKALLLEEDGEKKLEKYIERIKKSRAFGLMDNCNADIRQNRSIADRNVGMAELEQKIYKEDLFPEKDFTALPRHIQFCQALLREARVPNEKCAVADDVRAALDEVAGVKNLMEFMTHPKTPMSLRLRLQDKYLWPKVQTMMEKDLEDKKKQKEEEKNAREDQRGESAEGEQGEAGVENIENKPKKTNGVEKPTEDEPEETDPNKIFGAEYDDAEKNFPEAVPMEEVEKALKKWKEANNKKNSPDALDQAYADQIGVEKKDLQDYRTTVREIEKIINSETELTAKEELVDLFLKIIAKRLKQAQAPQYLVEEGDDLVDPAQLVVDVQAGNLQPRVWEDTEIKEKQGDKVGEVELTFVFDRTVSMEGQKQIEQRKMAVFGMEALDEFSRLCNEDKTNMDTPLEVRSEIYTIQASEDDKKPRKNMSSELGEAERVQIAKLLTTVPGGSTTDFFPLEAMFENLSEEQIKKIDEGVLKKIIIVFTDGESDDADKVQIALHKLRGRGVVVVGVGITEEGESVLTTYAPEALVAEDVTKLVLVLSELLREHLKDL